MQPSVGNDVFALHGRQLILRSMRGGQPDPTAPPVSRGTPPSFAANFTANFTSRYMSSSAKAPSLPKDPVGILGAGASGLYTALILDDLGIPYKILEARERVGGRLFTHIFQNMTGTPYNYFDVGAMRFPKISSMNRVFHLFDYPPLNTGDLALKKKLRPFYFTGAANNDTFLSYNGVTVKQNAVPTADPFKSAEVMQSVDPQPYMAAGTKAITDDVIAPFATRLLKDLENGTTTGWDYMTRFDLYSTRAYMSIPYVPTASLGLPKQALPTDVVNWCETFDKSTGWYDRALSETVLEAVAFGWNPLADPMQRTPWFCIDGGSSQIAETMYQYIKSRQSDAVTLSKRVTGIALTSNKDGIDVTTDNYDHHRFSHVVATIPLPVMRTIDMSKAGLSPMQTNALRQLNYGPSIKIGMQFRTAWWTTGSDKDGRPLNIVGGQTYTDSPLRTVVYPSYGDVKAGKTSVLIASYCWTEDAERLSALITSDKKVLDEMVLRELATIHNVTIEFLRGQLIDTFGWSWSQDPFSMGAFAFFGPGKFGNVYTSLTTPAAEGRLHFAGEALSVRHAWVEGAFDSAWRAVHEMLLRPEFASYQKKFLQNWGINAEWFVPEEAPAPPTGRAPRNKFPVCAPEAGPIDVEKLLQSDLLLRHMMVVNPEL